MKNLFLILIMVFGFTILSSAQNNDPKKVDQTLTKKEQVKWETKPVVAKELKSSEIQSQQPKVKNTAQSKKIEASGSKMSTKENMTPFPKKNRVIEKKLTKNSGETIEKDKEVNKTVQGKVYSTDANSNSNKPKTK
jgi:hypothetical protein